MMRLLVATDGSPNALRAVAHVVDLARRGVAIEAVACNVQPPVMSGEVGPIAPVELAERTRTVAAAAALDVARRLLEAGGITTTCIEATGDAADEILAAANAHRCDGIVVGHRGAGFIANLIGGSVSARVVRRSTIPVTVVS